MTRTPIFVEPADLQSSRQLPTELCSERVTELQGITANSLAPNRNTRAASRHTGSTSGIYTFATG